MVNDASRNLCKKRMPAMRSAQSWYVFIATLLLAVVLHGCSGSGEEGTGNVLDTIPPTATKTTPDNAAILAASDPIVIFFDETMDTGSLSLGGDLAPESDGGTWAVSTKAVKASGAGGDTLTLHPQSSWSVGVGRTLTVDANDLAGNPLPTINLSFHVVKGIVYVSTPVNGGDDAHAGTKESPKATVPAGIGEAVKQGWIPGGVAVSEGTYLVDSGAAAPTHVVLTEDVSIYGGYSVDFSRRDREKHTTIIEDASIFDSGKFGNRNRAVEISGAGVQSTTRVDGFTIQGGGGRSTGIYTHDGAAATLANDNIDGGADGSDSIAVYNVSSSPIIQNSSVNGGGGINYSYGFYNHSSSAIIQNSRINGGSGDNSNGIYNATSSSPEIQNNTIDAGSGNSSSYGIYNTSSSPLIQNNAIDGESGNQSFGVYNELSSAMLFNNTINGGGGNNNSYGIFNTVSSSPTILSNTVDGGSGNNSFGIYNFSSSSPVVQNNSIYGGVGTSSYGIYIYVSNLVIQNNTIDGGTGNISFGIVSVAQSSQGRDSNSTIENNIVFTSGSGTQICIDEATLGTDPVSFQNNDLFDCPTALYRNQGLQDQTNIGDVNDLFNPDGNVSVDPLFVDIDGPDDDIKTMADNDWHLSGNSPTEVTQGGLDLSSIFTADKDGADRTAPWSIGAYELN
jgi:hypothetical protein